MGESSPPWDLFLIQPTLSALDSELGSRTCVFFQTEAPRRVPVAPSARPPTAQEVCYRRAQQAQRDSASWLQGAPKPTDRLSSVHISAPGEKRRIAHVPNPRLATGKFWPHPLIFPIPASEVQEAAP